MSLLHNFSPQQNYTKQNGWCIITFISNKTFHKKKCPVFNGLLFGVKRWIWSDVSRIIILPYHVLVHYIVSFLGVSREPQTNLWEIKESYSYIIWHNLKRHSPPKKINFPTTWIHNFSDPIETSVSFYPPPPS